MENRKRVKKRRMRNVLAAVGLLAMAALVLVGVSKGTQERLPAAETVSEILDGTGEQSSVIAYTEESGRMIGTNAGTDISRIPLTAGDFNASVVTVGVRGHYYANIQEALDRINEIRLEACREGLRNPANPTKSLTINDYHPVKWSSTLEKEARQRAAEASLLTGHVRPNGQSCWTIMMPNNLEIYEVLAWNQTEDLVRGIEQFYEEKNDYIYSTGGESGHYMAIIDPTVGYVGLGGFYSGKNGLFPSSMCGRFAKGTASLDETYGSATGEMYVPIEVKSSYLGKQYVTTKKNSTGPVMVGTTTAFEMWSKTSINGGTAKVFYYNATWTSSNSKAATVQNGNVTARAVGTTVLKAKAPCGVYASVNLEVIPLAVTVTLNQDALALEKGGVGYLKASVMPEEAPDKTLRWSTSNKAVATITSKGKVTAAGVGTARITVSTVTGHSAVCTVKVTIPPTKITLDRTELTLGVEEVFQLTETLPPHSTQKDITWISSDSAVVSVKDGKLTANRSGTAVITAKTYNGKTAACQVTVKAAPTKITLNRVRRTLGVGETDQLTAKLPANTASEKMVWTSSQPGVAEVSETGLVTCKSVGKSVVAVKAFNGVKASCVIIVQAAPPAISMKEPTMAVGIGETYLLETILPENTASGTMTWTSSNTSVASVSSIGRIKGRKIGTAAITVKTFNGKTDTCQVTVKAAPDSVTLNETAKTLGVGEQFYLTASIPVDTVSAQMTWESDREDVASVSADGKVKAVGIGTANITVSTFNGVKAACRVTVKAAPTEVTLDLQSVTAGVGESVTLKAAITRGSASELTWASGDESIVSVENGRITALQPGVSTVSVKTFNGLRAACRVTVKAAPEEITLIPEQAELGVGETLELKPALPDGAASYYLGWVSGSSTVASVANGVVTAKKTGTVTIFVYTYNQLEASCVITVKEAPESLSLSETKRTLGEGETAELTAILPEGSASAITWTSSDEEVVTVKNGKLKAGIMGSAVVTASAYNGVTASCTVTVKMAPSSILLLTKKLVVGVGETAVLKPTLSRGSASALSWSSGDGETVTVENGTIRALQEGTAVVTVRTYNNCRASCTVVVRSAPESVSLSETSCQLGVGETNLLEMVLPKGSASNKVIWSSANSSVVTVKNGLLTAVKKGSTSVVLKTYNGKRAVCKVVVRAAPTSIQLSAQAKTLGEGEKSDLRAILPGTSVSAISWESDNSEAVTVDNGSLKALQQGTAVITARTFNGLSASCTVTVKAAPEEIGFSETRKVVGVGEKLTLKPVLTKGSASEITWISSSEETVSVNSGVCQALQEGVAVITAKTFNNLRASCTVVVQSAPEEVSLEQSDYCLGVGESVLLEAILPKGSASSKIYWITSDSSVVTVKNGLMKGVKAGTADVIVKTYNGKRFTCHAVVKAAPEWIALGDQGKTLGVGEKYDMEVILPEDSASQITWSSSDSEIVTVSSTGRLTAVSVGSAVVLAQTFNGRTAECTVIVKAAPEELTISESKIVLGIGESTMLSAAINEGSGSALTWTSGNSEIADVEVGNYVTLDDAYAVVTGLQEGITNVSVRTFNGLKAVCYVVVKPAPTELTLNTEALTLGVGETYQLKAALTSGSASRLTWTSTAGDVAAVDENGLLTVMKEGTATITVSTFNGLSASCVVTAGNAPDEIGLNRQYVELGVGEKLQLEAWIPEGTVSSVTWSSSDSEIVTVSSTGRLTAVSVGSAVVSVQTFNGRTAECTVIVKAAPEEITLNESKVILGVGEYVMLTAVLPEECSSALTWVTSNSDVVSLDRANFVNEQDRRIYLVGEQEGTALITVRTYNSVKAVCSVIVRAAPTELTLDAEEVTLGLGETRPLTASVAKTSASYYIGWYSDDESVVSVDNGILTANGLGSTVVTATTYNGVSASCTVTVKEAPARMTLSKSERRLGLGEKYQLEVYLTGDSASAITWTSSDDSVASVADGKITALQYGSAEITAETYNGLHEVCRVTVMDAPSEITLNESRIVIGVGEMAALTALLPEGSASSITWTIGDSSIASVHAGMAPTDSDTGFVMTDRDDQAVVIGQSIGVSVVTAKTFNGQRVTCTVIVRAEPDSVSLDQQDVELSFGSIVQLTAVLPKNTASYRLIWRSEDEDVVRVEDGMLIPVGTGMTIVTVETYNGLTASCLVTVS